MKIVNLNELAEIDSVSPGGRYASHCKNVSVALGAPRYTGMPGDPHPFDLQIRRVPPGKAICPYHSHTTQWELFVIVSGKGRVRRDGVLFDVQAGDAFVHPPGVAHQLSNPSATEELVVQIIASNPEMDLCHYPDSNKWGTRPLAKWFRLQEVDYFDGEE